MVKGAKYAPNGIDLSTLSFLSGRKMDGRIKILMGSDSHTKTKILTRHLELSKTRQEGNIIFSICHTIKIRRVGMLSMNFIISNTSGRSGQGIMSWRHLTSLKQVYWRAFLIRPLEMMATGGFVVVIQMMAMWNISGMKKTVWCLDPNDESACGHTAYRFGCKVIKNRTKNGRQAAQRYDWENVEKDVLDLYIQ